MKVVVNGTFDILHLGHLRLLQYAKSYSNSYVLVLIDSDRRVRELKGSTRPINSEFERTNMLLGLKAVDEVKIFDSDKELQELLKDFDPDIMVKGSDYLEKPIIGSEYCKKICFYDKLDNYSTTKTIQNITNRR